MTLLMQILTIAHVYGHNDFFKNNFTFRHTRAELAIDLFKVHTNRIRSYVPSRGRLPLDRFQWSGLRYCSLLLTAHCSLLTIQV